VSAVLLCGALLYGSAVSLLSGELGDAQADALDHETRPMRFLGISILFLYARQENFEL
jgi:hypothetical protein